MTSRSQFCLAIIPLLFAVQQFSEGLIWLNLSQHIGSQSSFINTQRSFLIFAFIIPPIWIPLAFAAVEKDSWRRILITIILCCGIGLSLLNLSYALKDDISVRVVNHSLQYIGTVPQQAIIYPLIVLLPCFISSLKKAWLFGLLIAVGYFIADYFYAQTFVSVWCFFAALVSICVYKILKTNQHSLEKALPETCKRGLVSGQTLWTDCCDTKLIKGGVSKETTLTAG